MNPTLRTLLSTLRRQGCRAALLIVMLLLTTPALACRETSRAQAFSDADIVLVGFVSSVRIPALEHLDDPALPLTSINAVGFAPRVIRMAVARQAKGPRSPRVRTIRVSMCQGMFVDAGERVVAFHYPDGSWRIDPAPPINRDLHLPPLDASPVDNAAPPSAATDH